MESRMPLHVKSCGRQRRGEAEGDTQAGGQADGWAGRQTRHLVERGEEAAL